MISLDDLSPDVKSFLLTLRQLESKLHALALHHPPLFPWSSRLLTQEELVEAIGLLARMNSLLGRTLDDFSKLLAEKSSKTGSTISPSSGEATDSES